MSDTLSEDVRGKLSAAVEAWADENLTGMPKILAFAMYSTLEKTMSTQAEKIRKTFEEATDE